MQRLVADSIRDGRMPALNWRTDVDAAFDEARRASRRVLLDFSAAPM
jgi:hypothetical protein